MLNAKRFIFPENFSALLCLSMQLKANSKCFLAFMLESNGDYFDFDVQVSLLHMFELLSQCCTISTFNYFHFTSDTQKLSILASVDVDGVLSCRSVDKTQSQSVQNIS